VRPTRRGEVFEDLGDGELIVLSREEPEAFAVVYERHAQGLLSYFARRTLDPEASAELTAETFAEAFASRGRFRDRGAGGSGWLYGVARHQLGRSYRTGAVDRRARVRLGLPERDLTPEDYERIEELIDFERVGRVIARAFSLLSEEQREAMTLRVIEGRPYHEVAEVLRCSEETARARVSRGLKRLRSVLESPQMQAEIGR
jgi:RNA polymerase sigma-70 factor (ECF subfamily)